MSVSYIDPFLDRLVYLLTNYMASSYTDKQWELQVNSQ